MKFKLSKSKWLLLAITFVIFTSLIADNNRISLHLDAQRLHNGKVITVKADVYFRNADGIMTIHYLQPAEYVLITNPKGEAKVYYPKTNEVIVQQNAVFSSENDMLYCFLTNKFADMGLKEAGFTLTDSHKLNGETVSTWEPPTFQSSQLSKIELVHENFFPIYTAYFGPNGKIFKKTYYSNYSKNTYRPIPMRIVEIDYLAGGDSIVSRKIYSNLNLDINSSYFTFAVPENAKAIKINPVKK